MMSEYLEKSACGVGFVVSRQGRQENGILKSALSALGRMEHRGACGADGLTGDGAGIMTEIPFNLFGYNPGKIAVATLFMPQDRARLRVSLKVFEETFKFMGLKILEYRDIPFNESVLGADAKSTMPAMKHAIIGRPSFCRTDESFNKLLYLAKQRTRTRQKEAGIVQEFYFTSLSTTTIVYKALTAAPVLASFYTDLQNSSYATRFALFHRRFSTNTRTAWDKAQPFRLIAHNGEINTIAGNRAWALSREKSLGLPPDELLTHEGISDSGSLNEMVEALKYRSSIPSMEDLLAIMMPPADLKHSFYQFWARALEPWDGPAFIAYSDGETIGARLDRNGFRPCRWLVTNECVYVASESGVFDVAEDQVERKGVLRAGRGLRVTIADGALSLEDPCYSSDLKEAGFDARLVPLLKNKEDLKEYDHSLYKLFGYTQEHIDRIILPMIKEGKEPIGSMGDTARIAIISDQDRSFFDYFVHDFAQVTNPPLDYLREKMVTDLTTFLGRRPNIFAPKELIPPPSNILLESPIISRSDLCSILLKHERAVRIPMRFKKDHGSVGLITALNCMATEAIARVHEGHDVIVLSDVEVDSDYLPVPSLLGLRKVVNALNAQGINLLASIIIESGEIIETHHVAALIAFGATAVCPVLCLSIAENCLHSSLAKSDSAIYEKNLLKCYESGLLKIMSKMGISVVRSYQGSELLTPLGLHQELLDEFFPRKVSRVGGLRLSTIAERIIARSSRAEEAESEYFPSTYQYKEHNKGVSGELHSMTNSRSRLLHEIVKADEGVRWKLYEDYLEGLNNEAPIALRHLLKLRDIEHSSDQQSVEPVGSILARFGSGAMSFGAISAESQRDIIHAMRRIGGRSNSGEGGENPFYYLDGTYASIKQVASARFGVTAEYLVTADEYQIKIGQGAKPGEGGQLMGVKVGREIARARHSDEQVDLISPPPQHDIYSIEDLKQLIHDLKSFNPRANVSVKLVAGSAIGTIAVGVVKAGADVVHISGWDGGTGASPLSSMKHTGLPWELGLIEVHKALVDNNLREFVRIRVDGGMQTGSDILFAALLGAEEFDFGKLLLVAEGCVMARICEKNRCPAGIATHDPKFKAKYTGTVEEIVNLLTLLAKDVQRHLEQLGLSDLGEAIGRSDLLEVDPRFENYCQERNLDLSEFLLDPRPVSHKYCTLGVHRVASLNERILNDCLPFIEKQGEYKFSYKISNEDRSITAPLSSAIAASVSKQRMATILSSPDAVDTYDMSITSPGSFILEMQGSAGQGFGVFLSQGIALHLEGEANDSVGKGMSGGQITIVPSREVKYRPEENIIIGNCALYGATGGRLYVYGQAGDRFAVRNSGAMAVVEGVGLHLCEYMTRGVVVVLGEVSHNVGAGMTGGAIYLLDDYVNLLNHDFVAATTLLTEDEVQLKGLLDDYARSVKSERVAWILAEWQLFQARFVKVVPKRLVDHINYPNQSTRIILNGDTREVSVEQPGTISQVVHN
jgi:glutamate synthase domain-containing protein 2/glutamate synthase domain-containing protein 1/glutamate synthase domain-containing protein 3